MAQISTQSAKKNNSTWTDWLDGFTLTHAEQGKTILTGEVEDQAALYGLIAKLRVLGVVLVSVNLNIQQSKKDS